MILVGQYDSPFVRRVAIALHHYGLPFERQVLSVFQDFAAMLTVNPLGKVPTLILDDGETLYDSRAIIEYLEGVAPLDRRLRPADPALGREMLRLEAVAIGLAEKFYERGIEFARRAPGTQDPAWIERLERQIESALLWLEERAGSPWLVGAAMTRADLALVVAATFAAEKQPQLYQSASRPRIESHRQRCEALPVFAAAAYSASEALATGWRPEGR